jgi:hypothetical protein
MRTNIVKWVSIAALLLAAVCWRSAARYQLMLNVVVSMVAAMVVVQAVQVKQYRWATAFLAIALLFNPAVPFFPLSGGVSLVLVTFSIAPLAISFAGLKPLPQLIPGGKSL